MSSLFEARDGHVRGTKSLLDPCYPALVRLVPVVCRVALTSQYLPCSTSGQTLHALGQRHDTNASVAAQEDGTGEPFEAEDGAVT